MVHFPSKARLLCDRGIELEKANERVSYKREHKPIKHATQCECNNEGDHKIVKIAGNARESNEASSSRQQKWEELCASIKHTIEDQTSTTKNSRLNCKW